MNHLRIKQVIVLTLVFAMAALTQASIPAAPLGDHTTPDLPSPLCDSLQPPAGSHLVLRAYAIGAQLYRWNGATWSFVEPVATLYSDAAYQEKIGTHYLGPTWENNNGSKVVATKVVGCTPDPTAVPWLLLQTVTNDGPSPLGIVTHI